MNGKSPYLMGKSTINGNFNGIIAGWWFGTFFMFPYIGNVIILTDELIFFRGVGIPPTSINGLVRYDTQRVHKLVDPCLDDVPF